jgi:hypothetical protein
MIADTLKEMLDRNPFEPFRVITSSGEAYVVQNPGLATLMKSQIFIARPRFDRWTLVPLLHVWAVEKLDQERNGSRRQRKRCR